ncbi:MAG: STM3941 family protein [Bacteroidota bacterium]
MERIEIYMSKSKSILLLLGCVAFLVMGVFMFLWADEVAYQVIGVIAIAFCSFASFIAIKRLIKSELAVIIDPKLGINIKPETTPTGFIKWEDIYGFREMKIESTRFVIILVKEPEKWIRQEKSGMRKKTLEYNLNRYNSPFNISTAGLDIKMDELIESLESYRKAYGK